MAQTNALELTKERIDSNDKLQTFVERAKQVSIPLFPETVQFTDTALKYGVALVTVDTNLDNYGSNRDIYKNESGGFCLHLSKINEISQQAGVQITDSRILERKTDEQGRVVFISHQVKGELKSVDGSMKRDVATGKYDYARDKEKYRKRDGSEITGMINSRRSHAEALAESNAKTRLYNKLVAKLPSSFTMDELKKPFLIPYVLEDKEEILKSLPEETQIQIKTELARKRLGLTDAIYGTPNAEPQKQITESKPQAGDGYEVENPEAPEAPQDNDDVLISPEEELQIRVKEIMEMDDARRAKKIIELVEKLNYVDPKGKKITESRVKAVSQENQKIFVEKLLRLESEGDEL